MLCRFTRFFATAYLLFNCSTLFALSAGDIQLNSWLGEPLKAELLLSKTGDLTTEQIKVRLAPREIYQRYQVAQNGFQQRLTFALSADNNDTVNVSISTEDPIKEPYQHFVLQILWPEGELYKEFKILIDPKQ
jgi:pilus assembly protein FimV